MPTPVIPVDYGARLNEARKAYHDLMMGQSARVFVDQNGERIEYTAANAARLASYISVLERQCGIGSIGPMRVFM